MKVRKYLEKHIVATVNHGKEAAMNKHAILLCFLLGSSLCCAGVSRIVHCALFQKLL